MARSTRTSTIAAWVWAGLIVAGGTAVMVGVFAREILDVDAVVLMASAMAYTGLGLLIAVRKPGNRIAWVFYVVATWVVLSGASVLVGEYEDPPSPVRALDLFNIMFGNVGYFIMLLIPLVLLFYLFPDGRFLTPRWSWAGWVAAFISIVAVFSQVAATDVGLTAPDGPDWTVSNPIGFIEGAELDGGVVGLLFGLGFVSIALLAIPALIVRYGRSDAAVRSQIKWVVFAAVVVGGLAILAVFLGEAVPGWFSELWFYLLVMVFPVSVALAIIRGRLYEIDRIFSRTVAYLLVVGLLGLVYLVGAVWLPTRLLGEQPPLFVAATTLAIAAMFNPLRRTILTQVDLRFNRARYDSQRVLEEFTADLGNATDVDQLAQDSLDLVNRTMQPASAGIWIRGDD